MKTYKKFKILLLGIFITLTLFDLAWSSVEGSWDIQEVTSMKVTVRGHGSQKTAIDFLNESVFRGDGHFEMANFNGTWFQKGTKFTVNLYSDAIEAYFEESLRNIFGWTADVDLKKFSLTGKEKSDGTIIGKLCLTLSVYVLDFQSEGSRSLPSLPEPKKLLMLKGLLSSTSSRSWISITIHLMFTPISPPPEITLSLWEECQAWKAKTKWRLIRD